MAFLNRNKKPSFPVMTTYPEYSVLSERWAVCREVIAGEDVVKSKGEKYLPMATHKCEDIQKKRYEAYKMRTPFTPFTYMAYQVQHAMVFRRTPTIACSDDFRNSGLLSNVDGKGNSLYQFCSNSFDDLIKTGFGGMLLDMPMAEPGMTKYDAEKKAEKLSVPGSFYLNYYCSTFIEAVKWWFENGLKTSPEELEMYFEKVTG